MAYPLNVKTRLVSFGGAATVEAGIPLHIRISTESSRSLIWVENGYRLESLAALYMSATDGQEIIFEIPTTDQNGWLDAATRQAIIVEPGEASHLYTTKLEIFTEDHELIRTYEIGPYAVPEGPGTLDADLLNPNYDPIEGTLTVYIPGPDGTLSEEGKQATQEAKDARDAAEGWRDQAEGFRDESEVFSATTQELQDLAIRETITDRASGSSRSIPTYDSLLRGSQAALVPNPKVPAYSLTAPGAGNTPGWLSRDRTTLFSVSGARFVRWSLDSGATWQGNPFEFDAGVTAVRDLDDGEIMVFTGNPSTPGAIWRSTGWSTNKATASFTRKFTAAHQNIYFHNGWSLSVFKNIVLAAEYGAKDVGSNARHVHMSTDYGETFSTIFEMNPSLDQAHMHGVAYDPWWNRIWISSGDTGAATFIRYSDDLGETWQNVSYHDISNVKVTTIIPMPDVVLFMSDSTPNGVLRARRVRKDFTPNIEVAYRINSNAHITHLGYAAYTASLPDSPLIMSFGLDASDTGWTGKSVALATLDGYTFHELWRDTIDDGRGGLVALVGPTGAGKLVGYLADNRLGLPGYTMISMDAPFWRMPTTTPKTWQPFGEENMPRFSATGDYGMVSGSITFHYIKSTSRRTVTRVNAYVGTGGGGASMTMCKWGVYRVNLDDSLTLIAETANDPTRWQNPNTSAGMPLIEPLEIMPDTTYVVAGLCITPNTAPTLAGVSAGGSIKMPGGALFEKPRLSARLAGQVDLPETVLDSALGVAYGMAWVGLG